MPWPDLLVRTASGPGCSSTTECPGGRTQARAQSFEGSDVPHLPLLHTGLEHGALRQDQTRCLATAHPLADGASTDQPVCATNRFAQLTKAVKSNGSSSTRKNASKDGSLING